MFYRKEHRARKSYKCDDCPDGRTIQPGETYILYKGKVGDELVAVRLCPACILRSRRGDRKAEQEVRYFMAARGWLKDEESAQETITK